MNGCQNSVRRSAVRRLHGLLASLIVDSVALDVVGRTLFPTPRPTDQHRDALVMGGPTQIGHRRDARRISRHPLACLTLQKH
jgi:hypothetical protein